MKKVLALILMMIMGLSLTACSSGTGRSSYSSSSNNSGSSSKGSSSYSKCHYKEGGKEVCSSPCASGSNFCSYHTQYLNGIYNSVVGGGK